ncbi:MAG: aminoacyl-tRNA hydrolase [Acidobacteria bacterium]|nr:aminoacyl-tRNA hydrolase [Acidobacteriota bacterium]MBI3657204.1 aminoacyl-tRNA hydrolase [Acidobacteriota bacterium]
MWLIIGLGNPGRKYTFTRHNVGFMVVDALADHWGAHFSVVESQAYTAPCSWENQPVLLAKPQTYMNRSGEAVAALLRRHELTPGDLIVIYDDIDLPLGRLRLRPRGRSGGHRGVQSLIESLGSDVFRRLRFGTLEADTPKDTVDYVLSEFGPEAQRIVDETIPRAVQALETILREGVSKAMSLYNH